jgi:membrane associated rhomboid family serine protease
LTETATGLRAPFVVWALVLLMVGAYGAFALAPVSAQNLLDFSFALIPARFHADNPLSFKHWYEGIWPIFGHAFLHAGWWHVGLNAFFFFLTARLPALRLGQVRFLLLFLVSTAGGALAYLALNRNGMEPAVGASGAVCGVFTAYFLALTPHWTQAIAEPRIRNQWLMIFFINVVLMGVAAETGFFPIAWQAHLGGFLSGGLAYIALTPARGREQ